MKLKQLGITLFALALLTGCGAAVQPQETAAPETSPAASQSAGAGQSEAPSELPGKTPAERELVTLLDTMEQEVTVGAPDSEKDTVRIAAGLMNWGVGTELTADQVRQVTLDWLMNKGDAEGAAIHEKFAAVDEVCSSLLGAGGAEVLAAANVENAAYPWSDEPLETVEAMMNAVGLR